MRTYELHAPIRPMSRSEGRSSVAAAAYRAGVRLYDERLGVWSDYRNRYGVEHSRIYLPDNSPHSYRDRETLWNAAEKRENRKNSCVVKELVVAFPCEFHVMQRREAGDAICRELMDRYGCAVDISYHKPDRGGDQRNYHAHILFTDRAFDPLTKDGWAKTKYRDLSKDPITLNGKRTNKGSEEIKSLRAFHAGIMNHIAERDGLQVRVEHLTFKSRGIDKEPQVHIGPVANDMERKGQESERGDQNRGIAEMNDQKDNTDKPQEHEQTPKFDVFAGMERSKFQLWRWDNEIDEDRRCEKEWRALEKRQEEHYAKDEERVKAEIKKTNRQLEQGGMKGFLRNILGENRIDREESLYYLNKELDSIERSKEVERGKLREEQKLRRAAMEEWHKDQDSELEERIEKARQSFKEDESEGKGDQGGKTMGRSNIRIKSNSLPGTNTKHVRANRGRSTSYSGKEVDGGKVIGLSDKQRDATKSKSASKKRGRSKPDHDFEPPRGPSLGR